MSRTMNEFIQRLNNTRNMMDKQKKLDKLWKLQMDVEECMQVPFLKPELISEYREIMPNMFEFHGNIVIEQMKILNGLGNE